MKRILVFLCVVVGFMFAGSPESNLAKQGIDLNNARKAIDQCYIANREPLRLAFEIRMSVAYYEAKELGEPFTPRAEHIMDLEQAYEIMGDQCSDTEAGLRFAIQLLSLVGDFDEANPDIKTMSILLDVAKFIQDRFYVTSVKLDGPFDYKK